MTKQTSPKFAPEVRERAARMVFAHKGEHAAEWAAISLIAAKIGCNAGTLRNWVRQADAHANPRGFGGSDRLTRQEVQAIRIERESLRELSDDEESITG